MRFRPSLSTTVMLAAAFGICGWIAIAIGVVRDEIDLGLAVSNCVSIGALIVALALTHRRNAAYRRVQARLRDSNTRLRMAEEVGHLGHWSFHIATGTLSWSDEVFRIYGLDPQGGGPELHRAIDAFHPDDRAVITTVFQRTIDTGKPYDVTLRLVRPDEGVRHVVCCGRCEVDEAGTRVAVFGTIHDITELEQAERRRRRSDARYRLLAENTSELVMLAHDDGRRSYISPAAIRLLGFTPEELAAMRLRDYVHPDDLQRLYQTTLRLGRGETEVSIDYRALHKDGRWIWVEGVFRRISGSLKPDDPTIVATFRSIEERHAYARELEAAKETAEAAARAKSDFLANMSHELRTPLTGLLGVCDLLANDPGLGAPQRRLSNLAADSGRLLLTVVNDILDFSRIEAGKLKLESLPVDLHALVYSTAALVSDAMKRKQLYLETEFAADAPEVVVGDPIRLRQVLLNLIGNAVKFTEHGGVTVRVRMIQEGPRIRVTVADTGIGVAADTVPQLFDRFRQADTSIARRFGGSGLGLAICKQIVTMMGGAVGAESRLGEGSTFWFEFPCARADAPTPPPEAPVTADLPRRKLRLLLAEDNVINREIITSAVRQQGHEVMATVDGAAAYEAFTAEPFDAVLMDIQMPGTDGLTATALIRAFEAARGATPTPIIALTANAIPEEIRSYLAAGMSAYVAKPVVWAHLFDVLDRVAAPVAPAQTAPTHLVGALKAGEWGAGLFSRTGRKQISDLLSDLHDVAMTATG